MTTQLETERLILRQWKDSDREPWAAMNADPQVLRFFPATRTREQSDASIDAYRAHLDAHDWGMWAVELKQTGEFIGMVGLWPMPEGFPAQDRTEIGWRLDKPYWGKGYAPEGARAVLKHAFTTLGLPGVVSMTTVANAQSRRVMEKLGLTRDPAEDFVNPSYEPGSPIGPHVLYRLEAAHHTTLETERLMLRGWQPSDRAPFARLNADPEVMRYFPQPLTREESDASADRMAGQLRQRGWGRWAVELKTGGDFIGFIGLAPMPEGTPSGVEVAWRLDKPYWGKGYAPEGARACLHHAFSVLSLPEVVSMTTVTNRPSRRVMEKIGMTHDPAADFRHPSYPQWWGAPHVLYRIGAHR
ncbi:GNAT family N-acetyltransferase [Kineosporia sp. J2-2]|uniref:GNAT family N-acetyltransferase n=1 Tax=Kineosporia corallincola TaxID=2835133 RepID=A0ABS5THQ0_9ACTN|nr:GNAT family N-acetyltransferase [Kineosporia corallincola]MBT0770575.1 GNAT family N-acetyltransferase [Kineosporia corallincola]